MATDHPDITELLLWQSGELAPGHARLVNEHVARCIACQSQISEIDFFKESVLEIHSSATQFSMEGALEERKLRHSIQKILASPRPWMAATASVLIFALLAYSFTDLMPAARAETLLSKAAQQETSSALRPCFLRFESGEDTASFKVGMTAERVSGIRSLSDKVLEGFRTAGWSNENPLSAKSFLHWRESLPFKRDSLRSVKGTTEVTTSANSGPLRKAMLRIRSSDHHAIAGEFEFAEEMHLAPVLVTEISAPVKEIAKVSTHNESTSLKSALNPTARPAIDPLDVAEAQVRLELHSLNQDGNILLAVQREPSGIKVWGAVPTQEVKIQLSDFLGNIPQVHASIESQSEIVETTPLPWQPFLGDATPLGYEQLHSLYPNDPRGRQDYLNAIDTLTRRIAGEAKTRDGLLALSRHAEPDDQAMKLHSAITDVQNEMFADLMQLRIKLQPFVGDLTGEPRLLTYSQALRLYTLVHEVLFLGKSEEKLTLDEALERMRPLLAHY